MDPLYIKLKEMRDRPGMYLGEKSLTRLASYINGYLDGQTKIGETYSINFSDFNEYVKQYFDVTSNHDWLKVIKFYSSNDTHAVDIFYELLDKFLLYKSKSKEEVYEYISISAMCENRIVKETHYTDHGNAKMYTNPHIHEIKWLPDDSYYYDSLNGNLKELSQSFKPKSGLNYFDSVEEFLNSIIRGSEIEFIFNNKNYSITYPESNVCLIQIGNENSAVIFKHIDDLLDYKIDQKMIRNIITEIKPYFRRI